MNDINSVDKLFLILLIIGGLNWGLVGLFNLDLVAAIFGVLSPFSRLIYLLVGLSALYLLFRTLSPRPVNRPVDR
jgi:uncharacterized membrane protein YuzA (DUF378 family)